MADETGDVCWFATALEVLIMRAVALLQAPIRVRLSSP
jgi:hypothetical protein